MGYYKTEDGRTFNNKDEAQAHANWLGAEVDALLARYAAEKQRIYNAASNAETNGNYEEAAKEWSNALSYQRPIQLPNKRFFNFFRDDDEIINIKERRGHAYFSCGKYENAISDFNTVIGSNVFKKDIVDRLVKSYEKTGDKEKADNYARLLKLMNGGNAVDWYQLGETFENGYGVPKSVAIYCYRQSAKDGYAKANYKLGCIYLKEKNKDSARSYFEEAARQGHVRAKIKAWRLYSFNPGTGTGAFSTLSAIAGLIYGIILVLNRYSSGTLKLLTIVPYVVGSFIAGGVACFILCFYFNKILYVLRGYREDDDEDDEEKSQRKGGLIGFIIGAVTLSGLLLLMGYFTEASYIDFAIMVIIGIIAGGLPGFLKGRDSIGTGLTVFLSLVLLIGLLALEGFVIDPYIKSFIAKNGSINGYVGEQNVSADQQTQDTKETKKAQNKKPVETKTATAKFVGAQIMSKPSGVSDSLGSIPEGAKFTITGKKSGGWYPVEYNGTKGWVHGYYVRIDN